MSPIPSHVTAKVIIVIVWLALHVHKLSKPDLIGFTLRRHYKGNPYRISECWPGQKPASQAD